MDKLAGTMPRVPIRNHIKHFSGSLGLLGGFLAFEVFKGSNVRTEKETARTPTIIWGPLPYISNSAV